MGGLIASAVGALKNGTRARGEPEPTEAITGSAGSTTSSMAEWQISHAEQAVD